MVSPRPVLPPADRVLEAAPDAMVIVRHDGSIGMVNSQVLAMFGYARDEILGHPIEVLVPERFRAKHVEDRDHYVAQPRTRPMGAGLDLYGRRKDGSDFPVEISLSPIRAEEGVLVIAAVRDITERKAAELKLRQSLKEKEVLLQEVHHRVKNNLQVVSSMLSLQMRQIADPKVVELFQESHDRVRAIALFHEKLYQSKDLARVDIAGYLRGVTTGLFSTYGLSPGRVTLSVEAEDIPLGMDAAVSCGLIANELVSNSLKHAFPGGRSGDIRVALRRDGEQVTLRVSDDGVGLPAGVDFHHSETLGLRLVAILAEQLGGRIEVDRAGGTTFTVCFGGGRRP